MRTAVSGVLVASAILASPRLALACSVCVDPDAANRTAFIVTTVLLSVLPLLMVGGVVAWLWRRAAQLRVETALPIGPVGQLGRVSSPLPRAGSSRSTRSR